MLYDVLYAALRTGVALRVTSHNKHNVSLHVVLGEWHKNADNFFFFQKSVVWSNFIQALNVII